MALSHRMDMTSDKLRQQFEGQLCKYTNVMKGWQFRWFVLDPETGVLDYYLNESERKQRPRGSVHLAAAVISPSDEDSNTFTVNSATGDMFKLRAADARARHEWVSRIRSVAEMHTMAIAQSNPPLPPREHHVAPTQVGARVQCSLAVLDAFSAARDHIHRADQSSYALSRAIEDLPSSGQCIKNVAEDMLLLKATAQATVHCLSQCLSILQQQQISYRSTPATRKPLQYEEYDSKKSLQHEFSTVWPEPPPMSLLSGSHDQARSNSRDDVTDEEDINESRLVPVEEHKSVILHLLSQLKLGMDLTRVVLPTFILEKRSLLEMFADCMGHPQLFLRIADEATPSGRMLALVEWYLTSFHMGRSDSIAKKPYNPIIGETFHCSWRVNCIKATADSYSKASDNLNLNDSPSKLNAPLDVTRRNRINENSCSEEDHCDGGSESFEITYTAEQVSHHPPVTAFYVECPGKNMYLNASIWTKSNFSGMSVGVNMIGDLSLTLLNFGEQYDFNLPSAYARSIISVPWVELGGKATINCPVSGYSAAIIFHTKPFYGGKVHQVTAEVKNDTGAIICKVQGEWNSHYEFIFPNGETKLVNVQDIPTYKKRVRKISEQEEFESRKLWYNVTEALKSGDIDAATQFKQRLEERQRVEERLRKEAGLEFETVFFHKVGDCWVFNNPLYEE